MDRGNLWARVHRVTKSQTQLGNRAHTHAPKSVSMLPQGKGDAKLFLGPMVGIKDFI